MENLIVINNPDKWILKLPNTRVVSPRHYIMDAEFAQGGKYKVYNLCNAFNYQNMGYYVSLLARARMHHPEPSVRTIMDFASKKLMAELAWEAEEIANKALLNYPKNKFELDIYFGKCIRQEYNKLGRALFSRFQAPMFSASFKKKKSGWILQSIDPFSASDIDSDNSDFIVKSASAYISRPHRTFDIQNTSRYSLAILADENEEFPPSNKKALARFVKAAQNVGFYCEIIGKSDFDRIGEFDALFIRSTTNVNNYTYRFSRYAYADGIVVVDDPNSIVRCANKVFQTEQALIMKVPIPNTMILHKDNIEEAAKRIGFPLIVKQPDSQFSQGVFKAENMDELKGIIKKLMKGSALLIAQEFVPTKFDWRIGIFNRKPIFVCKYYMAASHWQIINSKAKKADKEGRFETFPVEQAPQKVVNIALKAANLIGDGLYGVDVKETDDGRILLIEVNDNPNIDAGVEDKILGSKLYMEIMGGFWDRVNKIKKIKSV